jgi:hypothetical protein
MLVLLQVGCATGAPRGGLLVGDRSQPLTPRSFKEATPPLRESADAGGNGGAGTAPAEAPVAHGPEGGASLEEARERARRVEEEKARALVLEAQREGREPEAARKAEVDRALARVVGLASWVEEVGTRLTFTFWVEGGALTQVGYQEEGGSGRAGRRVEARGLERVLRLALGEYVGRRTGEVVLTLRREEARWAVDYDARYASRPAEARTLPVHTRGTPVGTFLGFHEAASKWLRAVRVSAGGEARVAFAVRLEDGRLVDWELLEEVRRTGESPGGNPRPLSGEVVGHLVQVLLPFTEGLGSRTVHVVLRAEHRPGEAEAWGRVESARVERPLPAPELSWYRAMHESILLRWREEVREGSAWLARKGVEEAALWYAGGIANKGLGFFATEGLEWVTRALGREPEVAAGWLRTAARRLSTQEQQSFEQLWRKVSLEGEQALTRGEREVLRGLFVRLEKVIQQPLSETQKNSLRKEARKYYAELYPQFAEVLETQRNKLPIHHRRPLQYAQLFPDENINAGDNLAMAQKHVHEEINILWVRFRKARPNPTADEVRRAAEIIDGHFEPWYHRADEPPGLLKTAKEAREAALRELRSRFPGLE